jgi:hypothetical protein
VANLLAKALSHPRFARALKTLIIGTEGRSSYNSLSGTVWFLYTIASPNIETLRSQEHK